MFLSCYYFSCFALSMFLTTILIYRWRHQYGMHFIIMSLYATFSSFGYWRIYEATELKEVLIANNLSYVGGSFATLSLLMCIFDVCKVHLNNYIKVLIYAVTCLVYGTSLTGGYSDIFYKSVALEYIDGRYVFVKEYGFFHTVFYVILVSFMLIGFSVLMYALHKKKNVSVRSVRLMFLVMVINYVSFFLGKTLFDVELITAGYVLTMVVFLVITNRIMLYNVDEIATMSMLTSGEAGAAAFGFDNCFLGYNDVALKFYPPLQYMRVDRHIDETNPELAELSNWLQELKDNGTFETFYQINDKYYKVSGKYLLDDDKSRGYTFIFTDYTEEKERSEERIRIATKAKSDILARMSHEIRTPINAILSMNEMVLRTATEENALEYAEDVKQATNSLLEIVNEILDFSKIDSGKMELVNTEYNLSNLLNDVINMFSVRASSKGLTLIPHVDMSLPVGLFGDDVKLRQILANLLSNAIKYTVEGAVELRVTGSVEGDNATLQFCVLDTGIGIKPENISKLFTEFERIEDKETRGVEGTGLGMSITTRLLDLMDSKLEVDSYYGLGSQFYFDITQPVLNARTIADYREDQKKKHTVKVHHNSYIAPEANILVVDDNKMNRKVFCSLLEETQIKITQANSGAECLRLIRDKRYDLIFMDHMMPEMDGVETFHRLRSMEDSRCRNVPVVVLTANAISGAKEYYLQEGFDDFLAKPFKPQELEQIIYEFLPREYIQMRDAEWNEEEDDNDIRLQYQNVRFERLKEVDMIRRIDGLSHFNGIEEYIKTLEEFCVSMQLEVVKLRMQYDKLTEDRSDDPDVFRQYRIQVHSMKGSANLLGAVELGETAYALEKAASEENRAYILKETEAFLDEWLKLKELLEKVFDEQTEKKELDVSVVTESLDALEEALNQLNIEETDEMMNRILMYTYPGTMEKDIQDLKAFSVDLDEENAKLLIRKLKEELQKI